MFLFLGVLLVTIVAYILRFHYEIVHAFYLSLKITGPPALPIVGNGLMFLNNSSAGTTNQITKKNRKFLFKKLTTYSWFILEQKILISSSI